MPKVAGVLALLPSCLGLTHSGTQVSNMYDAAYNYVKTSQVLKSYCREFLDLDPEQCVVAVADSTVFMEYSMYAGSFAEEIEGKDEIEVLEFIIQRDREREQSFEPTPISGRLEVDSSPKNAPLCLFFADPLENALLARILGNCDTRKSYAELTQFNTGVTFLFFFDGEGAITKVVESVTHYD